MDPQEMLALARAQHPRVVLDDAAFLAHVTKVGGSAQHAADLYLACACVARNPLALETFVREHFDPAIASLARTGLARFADEAASELREKLLVGDAPKLATYAGRGPLAGWVRIAATRAALSIQRRKQEPTGDDLDDLSSDDEPAELRQLRAQYGEAFRDAFAAALASLDSRDRSVLRLHLLDGLVVDEIGQILGVHRATAARWIVQAKDEVRARTRKELSSRVKLDRTELESVVRALDSRIDVSIQRILRDDR